MTPDQIRDAFDQARHGLSPEDRKKPGQYPYSNVIHPVMCDAEAADLDRESALMLVAIEQNRRIRELRAQLFEMNTIYSEPPIIPVDR